MQSTGRIKAELQSLGVRMVPDHSARKGGAGPAEGQTLFIDGVAASVPTGSRYVDLSPYRVKPIGREHVLLKGKQEVMKVTVQTRPRFYDRFTDDGIAYNKIALRHGGDCLATTVFQKCIYWNSGKRCRFCAIELSLRNHSTLEKKSPAHLSEVAQTAKELDGIRHVVLTTGIFSPESDGVRHIGNCVHSIKTSTQLPIHVQIEPPSDLGLLRDLKDAGADTIGLHIESFDSRVLSYMAPAKAELGLGRYTKAWETAVRIFGVNQVSSFLIMGLGESPESIIKGSRYLAERGVYPFLVPLRPIPGSLMGDSEPPPPATVIGIYEEVAQILRHCGISSRECKAGCVHCGACSALPEFES